MGFQIIIYIQTIHPSHQTFVVKYAVQLMISEPPQTKPNSLTRRIHSNVKKEKKWCQSV